MFGLYCKARTIDNELWVEGYYMKILAEKNDRIEEVHFILKNLENSWEIDPNTICVFTGRYDCTLWEELTMEEQTKFLGEWNSEKDRYNEYYDWLGKKIYDHDILLGGGCLMHVFFDQDVLALKIREYALTLYEKMTEQEKMIIEEYGFDSSGTGLNTEEARTFALCNTTFGMLTGIHKVIGNYLESPELLTKEFYEESSEYIEKFRLNKS